MFAKEGCLEIIPYQGYLYHINNCIFSNMKYECCVKKYNYNNKEFEKCGYSGTKENVIKHFILCEFIEYRCLFCDEYIFKMNLKKHMKHKCKFGIIKYENGDKYIGGKNYDLKEGYGTLYYYDDYIYEGEFKNDIREGYGRLIYDDEILYEGEWKNDKMDGFGIGSYLNGEKYEGEFKDNKRDGYGKYVFFNGDIYEGEWTDDILEGYGIYHFLEGYEYKGEFKGFEKKELEIDASSDIEIIVEPHDLSYYSVDKSDFVRPTTGQYKVYVGINAEEFNKLSGTVNASY
jgi:hypothetical protein